MWALQLLGYVAKTNKFNFPDWDWSQAGNEPQPYEPWCGGGGPGIGKGDPNLYLEEWPADSTVGILNHWFNVLGLNKEQFQYWNMDNEPEVWNGTHKDIMPDAIPAEDYIQRYVAVAVKAREAFPEIKIVGPVFTNEWFWYNWQDHQKIPDPVNPSIKYCWAEYFIKRIAEEQNRTGIRLLDVLDYHLYPGPEEDRSTTLQIHRVFYDTTYDYPKGEGIKILDEANPDWGTRSQKSYIFKRSNDWLDNYMGPDHGVTMGMSEFGSIYKSDPNVVTVTYASLLGTFAENNVEIFSPWDWYIGQWEVMHLFTRYAGTTSVSSSSSLNDVVSAYSSLNAKGDTLTVMLVNRNVNSDETVAVSLQNATTDEREASFYRLSNLPNNQETFFSRESNSLQKGTVEIANRYYFSMTLPKLSVTAVVVPLTSLNGNRDLSSNSTFNLYPNPATYQAKLVAEGLTGDAVITVADMLGRTLKMIQAKANGGKIETTIDVNAFEKGVYFVKVQNGSWSKSQKLMVK
jgi:hypothetical protein